MANANQRVENLVAVPGPDRLDGHALATKFRLFDENGTPIDVAGFEARLAALEGKQAEEEVAEDEAEGADGGKNEAEKSKS